MSQHMYIRHAVGSRLLLDSKIHPIQYEVTFKNGVWLFTIQLEDPSLAEQLLFFKDELNLFIVGQDSSQKSWYYSSAGLVEYDHQTQQLRIKADHKIDYSTA